MVTEVVDNGQAGTDPRGRAPDPIRLDPCS